MDKNIQDLAGFLSQEIRRVHGKVVDPDELAKDLKEGRKAFLGGYDSYVKFMDGQETKDAT